MRGLLAKLIGEVSIDRRVRGDRRERTGPVVGIRVGVIDKEIRSPPRTLPAEGGSRAPAGRVVKGVYRIKRHAGSRDLLLELQDIGCGKSQVEACAGSIEIVLQRRIEPAGAHHAQVLP